MRMPDRFGGRPISPSSRSSSWLPSSLSQSWIRKSAQDDKWSFCLKAAMMAANRRDYEQTTAPEPHTGIQGQGGTRRRQGRSNAGSAGRAFRCSPQSDYDGEGATRGGGLGCFRGWARESENTDGRSKVVACEDRRADTGERFFRGCAHQGGIAERKAMIDREHDLSITKQAEVLKISRGSVYYLPRPVSSADLAIMRRLDQLHLEFPFAGSRRFRGLLAAKGRRMCSIAMRGRSLLARHSPACSPTTALPSAWTAKAPGGTTSSSSGYGAASSTRRCICGPMKASERREIRSAGISTSTIDAARIRALTEAHRIKPT